MEHFNFNNQTPASPDCSCSKCPPPGCSCGQCVQFLYTINGLVTQSTSSSTDNLPTVALVAPVLLLAALPGKMTEPVTLVALAAATAAATETSAISESASKTSATSSTAPAVTVVHAISLGTLAGEMADPVAAVTHGASGALAIRALAGKVAGPEERNSIIACEAF